MLSARRSLLYSTTEISIREYLAFRHTPAEQLPPPGVQPPAPKMPEAKPPPAAPAGS